MVQDNPELLAPVQYDEIRALTARMQQQISSRTIDSPSWEFVRSAKMATRMYAPLGTLMSLGEYVRITRTFVEAFKASDDTQKSKRIVEDQSIDFTKEDIELNQLRRDLKVIQLLMNVPVSKLSSKVLSRPACSLGYQRRSHCASSLLGNDYHADGYSTDVVHMSLYHISSRPGALDPSVHYHIHRRPELQKNWASLGHL